MAWIGALITAAGAYASSQSTKKAAKGAQYRPWNTSMMGLGGAQFADGFLSLNPSSEMQAQNHLLNQLQMASLAKYGQGQQNALGQDFLRGAFVDSNSADSLGGINAGLPSSFYGNEAIFQNQANLGQEIGTNALTQGLTGYGGQNFLNAGQSFLNPYQAQDFSQLRNNLLTNFDPNQAASQYTDLLRQQAMPEEQRAVNSTMSNLFGTGRLGTTGGANVMGRLAEAQNQADLARQIAGQQFGLQQQLQAQAGLDAALNAEQGRQLGAFGANQTGMLNQFGLAQSLASTGANLYGSAYNNAALGMGIGQQADTFGFNRLMGLNQAEFDRALTLNDMNYSRTQDRFNRAFQLFGAENALNQQDLANFQGLLGGQHANNQQLLDLARIGASVGQAQTAAGAQSAMLRNQANQDMIAGFLGAYNSYQQNKK